MRSNGHCTVGAGRGAALAARDSARSIESRWGCAYGGGVMKGYRGGMSESTRASRNSHPGRRSTGVTKTVRPVSRGAAESASEEKRRTRSQVAVKPAEWAVAHDRRNPPLHPVPPSEEVVDRELVDEGHPETHGLGSESLRVARGGREDRGEVPVVEEGPSKSDRRIIHVSPQAAVSFTACAAQRGNWMLGGEANGAPFGGSWRER